MTRKGVSSRWFLCALAACLTCAAAADGPASRPVKVYVPYEKLTGVFEKEGQGVFLPLEQFQRLWRAAAGVPAGVGAAPAAYLVSKARFTGKVGAELAAMQLELTVDVLADGWVSVPIGLGDVAVADVRFAAPEEAPKPLLRVVGDKYVLLTRGKGRRSLVVDFVRQLVTQPGLNVLSFRVPPAAITTLELTIAEENMKVDVEPMLAATTEQVEAEGKKATRLRAFLGSAEGVKLSWKPTTQAAADLAAVVISEQLQHIHVDEALISHEVAFTYTIHRRGVDAFTVQLPDGFRVTSVDGVNIARQEVVAAGAVGGAPARQNLQVKLFSPAKGRYALTVKMERFLKEPRVRIPLSPIVTQEALRRTGVLALTCSPRRSVELVEARKLGRVDTGRLPEALRKRRGVMAYRFFDADYGGALDVDTVAPRIAADHRWALGVGTNRLELRGRLAYRIERTGVFQLAVNLPAGWNVDSVGPADLVDNHQVAGEGPARSLAILLKREVIGDISLDLSAGADRTAPDAPVDFALPTADVKDLRLYSGQVVLYLADSLRAEVDALQQLQPLPLKEARQWASLPGLSAAMAFAFRSIDGGRPAGAKLRIAVKPAQVSAVVHRLVRIEPGSVADEALVDYRVLYAPVDTFYLKLPAALAEAGVSITGKDIKEKPRIAELPADQQPPAGPATRPAAPWAYYKVVLQSPVIGPYRLRVSLRRSFRAGADVQAATVTVEPILAAGRLSDQIGYVAVAKADTLAIGEPAAKGLLPGDPTSAADLPEPAHRAGAALAFRYTAPPFELSLPVSAQAEADVFTTIATAAIIEQVLARDGTLNTRATYLLATSRGDRLPVTLPAGAELFSVELNGAAAAVEPGAARNQRIVRLPLSAGQVTKIVLVISYGLQSAAAGDLAGPELPVEIPVQQTLWRVWVPNEDYLLWHDRVFSLLDGWEMSNAVNRLGAGQPGPVELKLPRQGQARDFVRQGRPGRLRILVVRKEVFNVVVWGAIVIVGVAALKLGGFGRCVLVLAAALAAAVAKLFAPLLAGQVALSGGWAALIVLGLWIGHWVFRRVPRCHAMTTAWL